MSAHGHRIAIIGAGWAGLTAAVALTERGLPVTVFEAARSVGGRARRVTLNDVDLDNGQHILIGAYRETLRIMRRVGADPRRLLLRRPLDLKVEPGFHLRAPRLPAPLHLAVALATARGMRWRERSGAIRFMRALKRMKFHLEHDVTVAELLDLHGQTGVLRSCLWEPLCLAALNTPMATASAQVFANVLRDVLAADRAGSDLLLPRADLGAVFPRPAVAWLASRGTSLHPGHAVRAITHDGDRFHLDADSAPYTHVIVAVAPQHAAALLPADLRLDGLRATIKALAFEPIYTCYLQYESASLPQPMIGFVQGPTQWILDRGALGGPRGLLAAVISGSGPHTDMTLDALAQSIDAQLRATFPSLGALRWSKVVAEKRATFSCRPEIARPPNATSLSGLLLAGDYTEGDYPATLEGAVRSGLAAAAAIP